MKVKLEAMLNVCSSVSACCALAKLLQRPGARLGNGRFDRFMGAGFNNALLMSLEPEDWVGAFAQLFMEAEQDWPKFFASVAGLATLQDYERLQQLQVLRSRHLARQQETQTDNQDTNKIQCQAFAHHILN